MEQNCRIAEAARRARSYFFPRRLHVPDHVWMTLERVYPIVDWERVDFYEGWPHFMRRSGFRAITLPDPHSVYRINIYFTSEAWQPDRPRGMATILHEGYHVLQMQNMGGGYGVGLVRPFIILYLHCWATNGFAYRNHPMEEPAYQIAGRQNSRFEQYLGTADQDYEVTQPLEDIDFVQTELAYDFWEHVHAAGKGQPARNRQAGRVHRNERSGDDRLRAGLSAVGMAASLGGWTIGALVLWIVFLGIEAVGLILVGTMAIISTVACGIYRRFGGEHPE